MVPRGVARPPEEPIGLARLDAAMALAEDHIARFASVATRFDGLGRPERAGFARLLVDLTWAHLDQLRARRDRLLGG
jgi:hypothetical protein